MTDLRPTSIRSASAFARACLLAYLFLIVYGTFYPFTGWHHTGASLFAYLFAPFPRYWTWFDVLINIAAYVPLGLLMVFAFPSSIRRSGAVVLTIVFGAVLSASLEAIQNYLPSRVPSNMDFLANAGGACIGALAGYRLKPSFLENGHFHRLGRSWFRPESGRALVALALWPLAQFYPQAYLFGHGELTPILSEWLSRMLGVHVDLPVLIRGGARLTVEQYWLAETIITACGVTGAVLAMWCMTKRSAPKAGLALLLVLAALLGKSFANALLFAPDYAFAWLTPGAAGGVFVGVLMLYGLAYAPPGAQRRLAIAMLLIGLAVVNTIPANHYFVATLQAWAQGKFLNFNGAAQFVSLFWPFLALWFLIHPVHHPRHE